MKYSSLKGKKGYRRTNYSKTSTWIPVTNLRPYKVRGGQVKVLDEEYKINKVITVKEIHEIFKEKYEKSLIPKTRKEHASNYFKGVADYSFKYGKYTNLKKSELKSNIDRDMPWTKVE